MANSTFPVKVLKRQGGVPLLQGVYGGRITAPIAQEQLWECEVNKHTINGSNSQQVNVVTIPAAGFVAGRLSAVFTGGGLASPVTVTADAADGDANTDLATAFEAAVATARTGGLAGVVSNETVASNAVTITFVEGVGLVDVAITYDPAQVITVQWAETLPADGEVTLRFTGGGLASAVDVTTEIVSGTPANVAALAVQVEADVEAASGLTGVVVSADDDTVDLNTIQMAEAIADVTITDVSVVPQSFTATFGGTATDGDYDLIVSHSSLPGPVTVRVTRSTTPATNADLAAEMEVQFEAKTALENLIDDTLSADSGAVYTIVTKPGVTGMSITSAAPSPGTLTVAETSMSSTIADATPAGPTITQTITCTVDLNDERPNAALPSPIMRVEGAFLLTTEAWPSGTTIAVGDSADPDEIVTASDVTATGYDNTPAATGYSDRRERTMAPTVDVVVTDASSAPATGKTIVYIPYFSLSEV